MRRFTCQFGLRLLQLSGIGTRWEVPDCSPSLIGVWRMREEYGRLRQEEQWSIKGNNQETATNYYRFIIPLVRRGPGGTKGPAPTWDALRLPSGLRAPSSPTHIPIPFGISINQSPLNTPTLDTLPTLPIPLPWRQNRAILYPAYELPLIRQLKQENRLHLPPTIKPSFLIRWESVGVQFLLLS
jgi:hypothetical protein